MQTTHSHIIFSCSFELALRAALFIIMRIFFKALCIKVLWIIMLATVRPISMWGQLLFWHHHVFFQFQGLAIFLVILLSSCTSFYRNEMGRRSSSPYQITAISRRAYLLALKWLDLSMPPYQNSWFLKWGPRTLTLSKWWECILPHIEILDFRNGEMIQLSYLQSVAVTFVAKGIVHLPIVHVVRWLAQNQHVITINSNSC